MVHIVSLLGVQRRIRAIIGTEGEEMISLKERIRLLPSLKPLHLPLVVHYSLLLPLCREAFSARSSRYERIVGSEAVALKKLALETIFDIKALRKLSAITVPSASERNLAAMILLEVLASISHCNHPMKWLKKRQEYWITLGDNCGFWQLRYQLEDAIFAATEPQEHALVVSLLERQNRMHAQLFTDIENILSQSFRKSGIRDVEITKRKKNLYGIYQKMQIKGKNINHITDLFGFRIVTSSVKDCYLVLDVLHRLWRPFPDRFKDYIESPKMTGYRSVHTIVLCLEHSVVEFQIRTREMDIFAKFGPASHGKYKAASRSGNHSS